MTEEHAAASDSDSPGGSTPTSPQNLQTTLKMTILNDSNKKIRGTKLDTGAKVNIISEKVVDDLSLPRRPYKGPLIQPLGGTNVQGSNLLAKPKRTGDDGQHSDTLGMNDGGGTRRPVSPATGQYAEIEELRLGPNYYMPTLRYGPEYSGDSGGAMKSPSKTVDPRSLDPERDAPESIDETAAIVEREPEHASYSDSRRRPWWMGGDIHGSQSPMNDPKLPPLGYVPNRSIPTKGTVTDDPPTFTTPTSTIFTTEVVTPSATPSPSTPKAAAAEDHNDDIPMLDMSPTRLEPPDSSDNNLLDWHGIPPYEESRLGTGNHRQAESS